MDPPGALRVLALSPHNREVIVVGTNNDGICYTSDGGTSWANHQLAGLFEQRLYQGSEEYLDDEIATALNPDEPMYRRVAALVFDPLEPDTFYMGGSQHGFSRASFGVARITEAGQSWERLPLAGLACRNVFDLAVDSAGEYLYAGTLNGTYRLRLR
jgi:hypothetical protein